MNSTDLAFTSAIAQAQLLRQGDISPLDLVHLYLNRIAALDPQLGSFVTVMAESAIADAQHKADVLQRATPDTPLPPLYGVPIPIKDLHPVAGAPCAMGVAALRDREVTSDDGIVERIKQAGLIILGKTATSELGSLPYTEPQGFPPTRNPWNLEYTPGGSSGGAAAAVAAGLAPFAQGSDAGGSIRGPAFCCGLVGIKPSRGRVSFAPLGDCLGGLAAIGPLARTVVDAAALLDLMSGYTIGDPYWLPDPHPSFQVVAEQGLPKHRQLKIAVSKTLPDFEEPDPSCAKAVQETAQRLAALGHALTEIDLNMTDLVEPFLLIWRSGVAFSGLPAALLNPMNQWFLDECGTSGDYLRALAAVQQISRRIVQSLAPFDVLLLPTYLQPPIRVGEWADLPPDETLKRIIHWIAPCPPFNATGQPAISIPAGFTPEGLPVGVQIVGQPGDEATLIGLASDLETAHPWAHHQPAIAICNTRRSLQ
jgi:amidase